MEKGQDKRTLTDDDVKAIVDELESRIARRFYTNLGKGVFSAVWKVIVTGAVLLAAYGTMRGGKLPW